MTKCRAFSDHSSGGTAEERLLRGRSCLRLLSVPSISQHLLPVFPPTEIILFSPPKQNQTKHFLN